MQNSSRLLNTSPDSSRQYESLFLTGSGTGVGDDVLRLYPMMWSAAAVLAQHQWQYNNIDDTDNENDNSATAISSPIDTRKECIRQVWIWTIIRSWSQIRIQTWIWIWIRVRIVTGAVAAPTSCSHFLCVVVIVIVCVYVFRFVFVLVFFWFRVGVV